MGSFPRHWCALCLCIVIIVVQCQIASSAKDAIHPPGRFKRGSVIHPITEFFTAVKSHPVDLIILMERTWSVGRWRFYLRARKLVSHVMRYYIKMGPSNVRLVVATFADDFTIHINGIFDSILKCQIWDEYWDDVVLDDNPRVYYTAHVKRAYEQAKNIFDTYSAHREKYIWLLTSGNYRMNGNYDPQPIARVLVGMGVKIVATKVGGVEGFNRNIEQVVNSKAHHGGEVQDWITILKDVTEIIDETNLARSSMFSTLCYCEQSFGFTICGTCINEPCTAGNTCSDDCFCPGMGTIQHSLCPKLNTRKVCGIYDGWTGRYCHIKIKECVRGTCANNGTCHEAQGSYTCTCLPPYTPESLCENEGEHTITTEGINSTAGQTSSIGPAVGGALGALTLIIILVVGICCWRKKRRPDTREMGTNTYNASSTSSLNPLTLFRRKGGSTPSEASSGYSLDIFEIFRRKKGVQTPSGGTGSYLEIESQPPAVPSTVPPPTVRPSNSKPRKSLRGILQYVPEHLHPITPQWEVEKAVSVINVDNQGAAGGNDDDEEDATDYENVGSKNMPGWEHYVIRLATEGGLRNFAIVRHDREAYVTTCEIWLLPDEDELADIYNVLLSRRTGVYVKIKSARYKVRRNNGKMMESWLEGRTPDVLCVGRSKQYLTLGVETDRANTGNCYQEVEWVRDNLSQQGK